MDFLRNPCCCTTLRTGGFIIAILEIICGVILVLLAAFLPHDLDFLEITNFDYEYHREGLRDLILFLWLIDILFASLLLHGIKKENQLFLKVWMIFKVSLIALDISIKLLMVCLSVTRRGGIIVYFEDAVEYLVYVYFIYVVFCLFHEMRDATNAEKKEEPKLETV
ncbi:hypothetical protein Ocin01_16117 [Orchesella cincta]|uniref:Uncharacterized protein n=1 Tax=Orchesella cincta TaxID=48709 RepID=A0A1D2MC64_ORCCI|nr:hypothetical protein Ocin01_16117 [Orchesella cincta]